MSCLTAYWKCGYYKKGKKYQNVIERMWRKGTPHTLLMGMKTGAITMGNSMEVSQRTKNRTTL